MKHLKLLTIFATLLLFCNIFFFLLNLSLGNYWSAGVSAFGIFGCIMALFWATKSFFYD